MAPSTNSNLAQDIPSSGTDENVELYSPEIARMLADRYSIEGTEAVTSLQRFLEDAGRRYQSLTPHDNRPRPKEIRAALLEIDTLARNLGNRLQEMDRYVSLYFWEAEAIVDMEFMDRNRERSAFGHNFHRGFGVAGEDIGIRITESDMLDAIDVVGNYAKHALDNVPDDKGGRRFPAALHSWLIEVEGYWRVALGRKFTSDHLKGTPITEAGKFSVDAINVIDPEIPPTQVISMMRRIIADRNKRTYKNP